MAISIVKYNAGNVFSVVNALHRLGVDAVLTDDPILLRNSDKVIFPGQGEASNAMQYLREHHLDETIRSLTQPVLGICIGQQLLCRHSEEGDTDCLGIIDADVVRFRPARHCDKIPAMGWNSLHDLRGALFTGMSEEQYVYFVHSYYVPLCKATAAKADYVVEYSAALEQGNFFATQFHPEKSGSVGEQVLRNFLML